MSRAKRIIDPQAAFHITNRSNNKEWFHLPILEVWEIFCRILTRLNLDFETEIHSFVLMSNHFHLILSALNGSVSEPMRYLQTEVSKAINRKTGRTNHNFGGQYHPTVLRDPFSYRYVYKYVLRNPVRAKMVSRVEEYKFSTAYKQLRYTQIPFTENFPGLWKDFPRDLNTRLEWLNRPTGKEIEELIGMGLRRSEFGLPKGNDFRIKHRTLVNTYDAVLKGA